jgi:hypothetical protein
MEEKINAYNVSFRKPEGNTQLGTSRRRQEESIKMNLKKRELERANWIHFGSE